METLLTFSEWKDKHGKPWIEPKYTPNNKRCGGVDVKRCQSVAAGKNAKIQAENDQGYHAYFTAWRKDGGELAKLEGENHFGENRLETAARYIAHTEGRESGISLLLASGKYEATEDGKVKRK